MANLNYRGESDHFFDLIRRRRAGGLRTDPLQQHGERKPFRKTYSSLPGRRGSGEIILNGAAAHLGKKGRSGSPS